MVTRETFNVDVQPAWCPGCGNFGILTAWKRALAQAGLEPHQVAFITGIGQSGKTSDYINTIGVMGLHGRPLPLATGFKLANHGIKVIVGHGDGDGYGEGGNHFLHAIRRNLGIIDMIHNNQVYALTRGQAAPTSNVGYVSSTTPEGAVDRPMNGLAMALSLGATFVARTHTANINHMVDTFTTALGHRGYALIEVMQVCVTFNRQMTYDYLREHTYELSSEGHDPSDRKAALDRAFEYPGGDRIPVGVFYQDESAPAREEQVRTLEKGPLTAQPMHIAPIKDYSELLYELMTEPPVSDVWMPG